MTLTIRRILNSHVGQGAVTQEYIDDLFNRYLELKKKYLSGDLDKETMRSIAGTCIFLEKEDFLKDGYPPILDSAIMNQVGMMESKQNELARLGLSVNATIKCPQCNFINPLTAQVCDQCGKSLK